MKQFARLITEIDQTPQAQMKVEAIMRFLSTVGEDDRLWMMTLFCQKKPKRSLNTDQLKEWVVEYVAMPDWLIEKSYQSVGDMTETLSLILPAPEEDREDRSLEFWMKQLQHFASLKEEDKKAFLFEAWRSLQSDERFIFHRLLTGGFRPGISQKLLVQAISRFTGLAENAIAHRLVGTWTAETTTYQELLFSEDETDNFSRPYPFQGTKVIEGSPAELGDIEEWQAEWKWDGLRTQLIKRGGDVFLWSGEEELITEKFPEILELAQSIPDGTVIDGEMLPFKEGQPLPFQQLQARINKKTLSKKQLQQTPCLFMAYDLLEEMGEDIRGLSLVERRQQLASLVRQVDRPAVLRLSETLPATSWEELAELREEARNHVAGGLLLKRKKSFYQADDEPSDWWIWKVDLMKVDAVLIYAQRGRGPNTYSEYTFAVWNEEGTLVPVAKVKPGIADAEILELNAWIKANTVERFGPVRSVKGELVFEIAFEDINHSKRHKSGVVMKTPQMLRWKKDRKASEADQLAFLKGLIIG